MERHRIFQRSELMIQRMAEIIDLPPYDDSPRILSSVRYAEIAWDHWDAVRTLSECGLHASANSLLRTQFETLVRSIWCFHCATETALEKLEKTLSPESEQSAKGLPQATEMLSSLKKKPETLNLYIRLAEFKDSSWKALNSFVHAGIHPLRRHADGHPIELILQTVRISNAMGLITAIQLGILSGKNDAQAELLESSERYAECLPPHAPPVHLPAQPNPD
jgi:hypothetical protein